MIMLTHLERTLHYLCKALLVSKSNFIYGKGVYTISSFKASR